MRQLFLRASLVQPGDVVFDGFCGTGMTGVAAQLCADRREVQELGYRVDSQDNVIDEAGKRVSRLGARNVILNDLAPIATFIAKNYNRPVRSESFVVHSQDVLQSTEDEISWMYKTLYNATEAEDAAVEALLRKCRSASEAASLLHSTETLRAALQKPRSKIELCQVKYFVWSDVFVCPSCASSFSFVDVALNIETKRVAKDIACPDCDTELSKRSLDRATELRIDPADGTPRSFAKTVLALVIFESPTGDVEKKATAFDKALGEFTENLGIPKDAPLFRMPPGDESRRNDQIGLTHAHHYFRNRSLWSISTLFAKSRSKPKAHQHFLLFCVEQVILGMSKIARYAPTHYSQVNQYLSGTLYVGSQVVDVSPRYILGGKISSLKRVLGQIRPTNCCISTESSSQLSDIPPNSLDYIFIDPPFGGNLTYSALNFLWESWHRVFTNSKTEAITNSKLNRGNDFYQNAIYTCFKRFYECLKPGRWITIEFSNTQASIWNAIQASLQECGFVVANVAALDKQQMSFKAITTTMAVKQDLVISAYKPDGGLEDRFCKSGHTVDGVWDFLRSHLKKLPVVKPRGGELEFIVERDPRILYDRMIAFYVCHGVPVPLSSAEFQAALAEKFPEREGMFFLPEQVAEWDKKRAQMQGVGQMSIFVEDEKSAIDWLRKHLKDRPSTYQDIQPEFMQQLGASWKKFETRPELRVLLEQNFLKYDGNGEVPGQIHGYLSTQFKDLRNLAKDDSHLQSRAKDRWYVPDPGKAVDVEAVRNKRLLTEFWDLCAQAGINRPASEQSDQGRLPFPAAAPAKKGARKKLKEVRTEAVRLGFKECFAAKNYATILALSEHLPENVIEEDEQLQMIHDMAEMRAEG